MNKISICTYLYGILAVLSLLLLVVYRIHSKDRFVKKYACIFGIIFFVDLGYMLLSTSKTLNFALFINKFIYFWEIILIGYVFLVIMGLCKRNVSRYWNVTILIVSLLMFALVCTGGTTITWYYEAADLVTTNNISTLVKQYGPLHIVYTIYVLFIFIHILMILVKKVMTDKTKDNINPVIMLVIMLQDIFAWIFGRYVKSQFELLTVSYLISEILFLLLITNVNNYQDFNDTIESIRNTHSTKSVEDKVKSWKDKYNLTPREYEVIVMLLNNVSRKDIAEKMIVSEHTIKKHTSHIYEKIGVSSRNELLHKLNEEITKED